MQPGRGCTIDQERWSAHVTKMYAIMLMRKAKSWFTDYNSNVPGHEHGKVRYFVPDPEPTDLAGGGGREGVAVDRDGIIYVAKTGAGGVYRYTKTKGTNTTR